MIVEDRLLPSYGGVIPPALLARRSRGGYLAFMLTRLRLRNFRCYLDHEVDLRPVTVAVGQNNAGKSTLTEALRLVALVVGRAEHLTIKPPPPWTGLAKTETGIAPYMLRTGFDFRYAFYGNGDAPAIITATFESGAQVVVYLGPPVPSKPNGELFARLKGANGRYIRTRSQIRDLQLVPIAILPQPAPFALEELAISADYVRYHMDSRLSHRHFRNQLMLDPVAFRKLEELVAETWPSLQIRELRGAQAGSDVPIELNVRDGPYVGEVSQMGSGLQMWLQMMWFIARTPESSVVVLDEPDVYMHPDLQRRVVRIVSERFKQVFIATHSIEIMSEVAASEILVVDRSRERSEFANTLPNVQRLLNAIGSVHNVHLARLWHARKFLLVEGDDLSLLSAWHRTIFPHSRVPLATIPKGELGGYSGFQKAVGTSLALSNGDRAEIRTYCLLDSDYYLEPEKEKRHREAERAGVSLWIWRRKEIENYLLVPMFLARYISERSDRKQVSSEVISEKLQAICETLRPVVEGAVADRLVLENRRWTPSKAIEEARTIVAAKWGAPEDRIALIPGSEALSLLCDWVQASFGVNINAEELARAMRRNEIPDEVCTVLRCIEDVLPFPMP